MCNGKSYLVEVEEEDGGQVGVEAGQDYAEDLIEAAKVQVDKLKSNGSDQQVISDAVKKIDWVHEHLKTEKNRRCTTVQNSDDKAIPLRWAHTPICILSTTTASN